MAEMMEESQGLESTTVGIYRTATVVKGGRRFSFAAMVVVGDRRGNVGIGYGKAGGVPTAIEKAQKDAKKQMVRITLKEGTIPHQVYGEFGASSVRLIPAAPGTGVIAGGTVRAVLEMVGVRDCLTKAYGSTNQKNLCKAAIEGLLRLRTRESVAALRSVEITSTRVEEMLEVGRRYIPTRVEGTMKAKGPVNTVGNKTGGGRGGRGGGGNRGRRGGGDETQGAAPIAPVAPTAPDAGGAPAAK
ncbi:MAG: 30S ribosomal protein S5 [Planctomycetes bacterium]|nr:30S ribosomal protein S5 [Planctomycetota bacterium]